MGVPLPRNPTSSPAHRWAMRLTAAVGVPLFLLGVLELGLRVVGIGHPTSFFLERTIDETDWLIPNREFTKRFFPAALAREPLPFRMAPDKPTGTTRIFLFGESAAYGDPEPAYGVGRFLEALLELRHPGRDFEVVCTATTAINSHVIVPIARDCRDRDGDLWILYIGNNEMVGPFGAGTIFGTRAPDRAWVKTVLAARSTRLGQSLNQLAESAARSPERPDSWRGIDMFSRNPLGHDDPGRLQAYRNFEENLAEILDLARQGGIPVLLSTVATNERDCAPFLSLHRDLPEAEAAAWQAHFREGRDLEDRGRMEEALAAYAAAAAIDDQHAELHFRVARCLLATGRTDEARASFARARDLDGLAVRADTRINGIIRAAIDRGRGTDLTGLDAAALLAAQQPDGLLGQETFHEHVHFTVEGNFRLARLMAEAIAARLPALSGPAGTPEAEFQACAERLAYTLWDRKRVWNVALDRVAVEPFIRQSTHAATTAYLRERMAEVDRVTTTASFGEVVRHYERALRRDPDDTLIRWNFAQFLERTGRLPEAIAQGQEVCRRLPYNAWPQYFVGSLLAKQGRPREAVAALRLALKLQPDVPFAREELERVLKANPSLR